MTVNTKYLKEENYITNEDSSGQLIANATDNKILADKTNYRVLNIGGGAFSENYTSFSFKSAGGYHPAKLRIYQDLIERQLQKSVQYYQYLLQNNLPLQPDGVSSMLNIKYLIQKAGKETARYESLPETCGSAWFVPKVAFVKDADAEMSALDSIQPKKVAYVREALKQQVLYDEGVDTTSTIQLVQNDNDYIEYSSKSTKNQFAVFSEIYYPAGWKAYIHGKESPIVRTNYVLRGLSVPAGQHKIEFKFAPELHAKGKRYASLANFAIMAILLSALGLIYLTYFKNKA
jgi:hypothetical protein